MKRVGYLFEKVVDLENIKLAIKNAVRHRKRKRKCRFIDKIRNDIDFYAADIQHMLLSDSFEFHAPYECEIQDYPKTRHLRKPVFYPDQIIMWAIKQVIEPVLNRVQYLYSFSGVRGRGNLSGKHYVERVLKQYGNKRLYVKQDDLRHFYENINNDKLKSCFRRVIKDNRLLRWIDLIVDIGGKGLPIGFPTSPLFGNFYLQQLDHFIKEKAHVKYYARFADDVFLADSNRRKLQKCFVLLKSFLRGFGLWFKNNRPIFKLFVQPIDFVGFMFYKGYTLLRDRTFYNLTRIVNNIHRFGGTLRRYSRYLSLLGIAKHINFRNYYLSHIKPLVTKGQAKKFISYSMLNAV
jgi:hypothetical protein